MSNPRKKEVKEVKEVAHEKHDNFVRLRAITTPIFSFKNRELAFVKILGPIFEGKEIVKAGEAAKKPAMLCPIIDLETGEQCEMICPTILVTTLQEKVSEYVGKCFEIRVGKEKVEGKNYKPVSVYEIECP